MRCPYCNSEETKVIDSRVSLEGNTIKRRRECVECERRFNTYEKLEEITLYVKKKSGNRERFKREKILRGLSLATIKRDIEMNKLQELVDEIENIIYKLPNNEIGSKELGDIILEKLLHLDEVAYVRFASVYKEFSDLKSFIELIEQVKKSR
ncbi:MAG: transcriptional repressor NrdR [Fusobacteriaceae bacterium]|nr:transcriptional repressor NrdR [Fusobacteriaceae bacterium]MBP9510047.1 transcriptional repressor NrdR [Fusobacteriaceae bacterium]